jgi:hypothetical protein
VGPANRGNSTIRVFRDINRGQDFQDSSPSLNHETAYNEPKYRK